MLLAVGYTGCNIDQYTQFLQWPAASVLNSHRNYTTHNLFKTVLFFPVFFSFLEHHNLEDYFHKSGET